MSERSEIIWRPTASFAAKTRIATFMGKLDVVSLADLQRRSVEDPEWYWRAVNDEFALHWTKPFRRVLDTSRGIAWPRWFEGGEFNFAVNCLDRNLEAGRGGKTALVWEDDAGATRMLTYSELARETSRLAHGLRRLGVSVGDRVGVFLPMCPEAVIATLAIARIGAIYTPCFSGYGAQAVASRLQDCEAKVLITADSFQRRGQVVRMKQTADAAADASPSVRHVVVVRRQGHDVPWIERRDLWWEEVMAANGGQGPAEATPPDAPLLIIYTSGTTGRPKGAVLTHAGFAIKTAHDFAFVMDMRESDRLFWLTDLGWLMGPMLIAAALLHGATAVLFEGVPDYPRPDRLWNLADRHRITVMGLSPTAVRALMPHGADWPRRHDLSRLRIFGSTGEPWNPEPYRWLFETVGQGRVPIMNYSGGTEISGGIIASFPSMPLKPCSFTGPIPGMAAEVFGDEGKPVREEVGELVITRPWPGMTAGFWKDPDRYEQTYWSRWPDVWVHGDWAYVDGDGFWFVQGRSDDTLKIAGKRLGPAEVESVLVGHEAVAEAATIGVPHEVKGEAIVCFAVLKPGQGPSEPLRAELSERVARQMGKALKPERVLFARELPKTRSAKIMRRVIRATYLGREAGDLSSLENPGAVQAIADAV
jgi:acetyl-CoA synthetase